MVKVTVIEYLLSKSEMSMAKLVSDITNMLMLEGEITSASKVNEGMLRHGAVRHTLPKDTNIRRALLAKKFEKKYSEINGKDLCLVTLKNSLKAELENHFEEIQLPTFEELETFKEEQLGNLIKNHQYGSYSEFEFIETTIILTLIRNPSLSYVQDKKKVLNSVASYIVGEEDTIEESLSLDLPLNKVSEVVRINAYRFIIGKLLEIR